MTPANPDKPRYDTRHEQFQRVVAYLLENPGSTTKEIDAACDVGSVTKILSDMSRSPGYSIKQGTRPCDVVCDGAPKFRRVHTYALMLCPNTQTELFPNS
jgi:hypothetical protein